MKGYCIREGCSELFEMGDGIEVVGEGFTCSVICSAIVEGTITVVDGYDW